MTTEQIYQAHKLAFQQKKFDMHSPSQKFRTQREVIEFLTEGYILPVLWNKSAEFSLSVFNQIGLYTLLDFSSRATEIKFKKVFINTLINLGL